MVILTEVAKHRHVPSPWVVGHCILGLYIFKGGQINFYPKASSGPPQSATFPRNPHLGWMLWTFFHSAHPNSFLLKRVSLLMVPWEAVGLSVTYTSFNLGSSAAGGHSINQVHGSYCHFVLAPHQSLLLSLTYTLWHHRPQLESWVALFFPMVTLALWPSSSSLQQPWGWHGDFPVWFSSKLLLALISGPSSMDLLSQTQHFLPCNREAPHSWSTYQRTGWPPLGTRLQLQLSGHPARLPGVCWWSTQWGLIASSISQHYSHLYTIMSSVFEGRWVVSSTLRGYWPLWCWSSSSSESKRHFGGSVGVWKHLFPRNNLFNWVSYLIIHPPHPVMMERGRHLFVSLHPLCLWSYISPCYGRSISYALLASTQFTGSLEFTIGTKA